MTYKSLISNLKPSQLVPIYLFYGEESFYIDKLMDHAEKNLMDEGMKAFNQSTLYGKEVDAKRVIDELSQFPMMAPNRIILLKEAQSMKTFNDLCPIFEKPIPHSVLIISYKKAKIDKRTKAGKALLKSATVFESKKLYDNQVVGWITDYSKDLQLKLQNQVPQMLSEYLGTDLKKIANELDKLKLTFGTEASITVEDVQDQIGISKEYNIFELQKALGTRNVLKANQIVKYFSQNPKSSPIQMTLFSLYNYFSKVYVAIVNSKQNDQFLMKALGLSSPYFIKEYRTVSRNFSISKVRRIIKYIHEADLQSKGVNNRSTTDGDLYRELIYKILH